VFDEPVGLALRCGGLPREPKGPLGYQLLFSIEGLTNEYVGEAEVLRDGALARVPTLEELEEIEFSPPVGRCEAFTTSGGTSTLCATYRGRLRFLDYKTVRYPGHCEKVRVLRDLGLLSDKPVRLRTASVVPRDVFHACATPALTYPGPDVVVLRAEMWGKNGGAPARARIDVVDFADDRTGFSAMQRMTGYPAAMVVEALARGEGKPGAVPLELALPAAPLLQGLAARGIALTETRLAEPA
jgi:lysine 6-dehydrogenase